MQNMSRMKGALSSNKFATSGLSLSSLINAEESLDLLSTVAGYLPVLQLSTYPTNFFRQ